MADDGAYIPTASDVAQWPKHCLECHALAERTYFDETADAVHNIPCGHIGWYFNPITFN